MSTSYFGRCKILSVVFQFFHILPLPNLIRMDCRPHYICTMLMGRWCGVSSTGQSPFTPGGRKAPPECSGRGHFNKEVASGGTKVQKFYFAGTMTVAVRTLENGTDVLNWVLGDHLGSTSATANADGSLNSVIQYTAFGREALPERSAGREIRLTQGVTPTKYRYTGQLAQAELGLDYYVARWYDPMLGHFTHKELVWIVS
jgi:RHS repeat-associated protein